jgi:hypothetical protein
VGAAVEPLPAQVALEQDGTPPGFDVQFETTRVQLAAMSSMRKAILCCFPGYHADVVLGLYVPMGPQGGVVGGTWSISVAEGVI